MLAVRMPPEKDAALSAALASSSQKITMLFASASPDTEVRIRVDREVGDIIEALERGSDRFNLVQVQAASFDRLRDALIKHQPHVLHISCHGEVDGSLKLEGPSGGAEVISKRRLLQLLRAGQGRLHLVLLNASHSTVVAYEIPPTIAMAIGIDGAMVDEDAVKFAIAFYGSLAHAHSVEQAFDLGLAQLPDDVDCLPVLFPSKDSDVSKVRERKFGI